jgi:hypothetical protein
MTKAPNVTHEDEPQPAGQVTTAPPTPRGAGQTFGEKAVGLSFNPSGDATVHELKQLYAQIIDICHARRGALMQGSEAHRLYAIAITQAQDAQMWGVKAATWKD